MARPEGGDRREASRPDRPADRAERPGDRAVYIISVAAELAGMHPQTLRIYERRGLLRPARTAGNTRRYSERDIERIQVIQRLTQDQGINLAGVKVIVEMERELEEMRRAMEHLREELARARRAARERQAAARAPVDIVPLRSVQMFRWGDDAR